MNAAFRMNMRNILVVAILGFLFWYLSQENSSENYRAGESTKTSESPTKANSTDIDWNDAELRWLGYEQGMQELKTTGKNGMLIIYADWCSTCKSYSKLFRNDDAVTELRDVVLIRVDKDDRPDISKLYDYDGEYVPRTFALDNNGDTLNLMPPHKKKYSYFLPADNLRYLVKFARKLKSVR
jgi:thiol:disulfide interchange protein